MDPNAFRPTALPRSPSSSAPGPTVTIIVADSRAMAGGPAFSERCRHPGRPPDLGSPSPCSGSPRRSRGWGFGSTWRGSRRARPIWSGSASPLALGRRIARPPSGRPKGSFFLQGLWAILLILEDAAGVRRLIPQFIAPERDFMSQLIFLVVAFMVLGRHLRRQLCGACRLGRRLAVARPASGWSAAVRPCADRRRPVACSSAPEIRPLRR